MKFDDILEYLGEFGAYQKRLYITVCIPSISIAMQVLLPVFILAIPNFRCAIPSFPNDTYISQGKWHDDLINKTIPTAKDGLSKCKVFGSDGSEESCDKWVYDQSIYESTLLMDIKLICGDEILRSHSNMIFFGGNLVGAFGLGLLSDLIGRKKTLMLSIILHIGTGIGIAFINEYIGFSVLRFFNGMANGGVFMTGFVIGMELVGPSKRALAGMIIMLFWALGLFVLGLIAYFIRDWRTLSLAVSCPSVVYLSYWWLLPESPRWLLSKGREKEAEDIIRKAAKVNKVELPLKLFDQHTLDTGPQSKIWHMFTDCRLLIGSLIIFFNWLVVSMVYYGLGLNVSNLSGDPYLNFTIANIAETISYVLAILLLNRIGRKPLHCGAMLLGGVACLATMLPVIYANPWVTTALSMIGKLGASGAFAVIYVYAAELFPTIVRNSGLGTSSMCARIGGMISPYIADSVIGGDLRIALPLIIFGASSIIAGLLCLLLPETLNRKMPETIDDAKELSR
ncbi:hypothetical protein LOTGIDRAFT_108246 [Lottia gigantea]|uniref:Major facilitator superfamily (MFS) profile domain-containing protein n=1 Tax=Lottia gigantea TaxID=225164 RepID=V4B680_LOTGI|nr:hypothetical protein LOTGIDRAFT_108246 [Lottia gigantea]ESO84004.1 hypothetical protein LOTGIDRAFT_108246 [Lottia gigantea]